MVQYRWIRRTLPATVIAASLMVTTGCGMFSKQTSQQIDPPPSHAQQGLDADDEGQAMLEGQNQITVYLKDRNGYIAPVTLLNNLTADRQAEQTALEMMIDQGEYEGLLPQGFTAVLPKGTQIKQLDIISDQKLAIVDFSKEFTDYNLQDERRIVEAVTWTLTGFPGIERVQFMNEGERLGEMPVNGFPLDEPISRNVGINLEKADGIDQGRSMAVTLYFSGVTPDDAHYYVPVTRLVDRSTDAARTSMEQLILGPAAFSPLNAVMTSDVQVADISIIGDLVTVDLLDESHEAGQKLPAELIQSVILSITENTGASKVQIQINGNADVVDTNDRSYSEPINRPDHVNALKS